MLRSAARSKGTWVAVLAALGLVLMVVLASPDSHPKSAQAQTTQDPLAMARASLVVDNIEVAAFNELGGITSSIMLPRVDGKAAQLEPLRIVLERNATNSMEMAIWHRQATTQLTGYRRDVNLTVYGSDGTPTLKIFLEQAWPAEYYLEQQGGQVLERVTMTANSIQRVAP